MLPKEFKKYGFKIAAGVTVSLEALFNSFDSIVLREVLIPVAILNSVAIATISIYYLKIHFNGKLIKCNKDRIAELEREIGTGQEIQKLKDENFKLERENSKIDIII